jgi:hypothetical protein
MPKVAKSVGEGVADEGGVEVRQVARSEDDQPGEDDGEDHPPQDGASARRSRIHGEAIIGTRGAPGKPFDIQGVGAQAVPTPR